jgi:hypothetical protein
VISATIIPKLCSRRSAATAIISATKAGSDDCRWRSCRGDRQARGAGDVQRRIFFHPADDRYTQVATHMIQRRKARSIAM